MHATQRDYLRKILCNARSNTGLARKIQHVLILHCMCKTLCCVHNGGNRALQLMRAEIQSKESNNLTLNRSISENNIAITIKMYIQIIVYITPCHCD